MNTSLVSRFTFFATLRFRLLVLVLLTIVPLLGLTLHTSIELRRLSAVDAVNFRPAWGHQFSAKMVHSLR